MTLDELKALVPGPDPVTGKARSVELDVFNWGVDKDYPNLHCWAPQLEKLKIWGLDVSWKFGLLDYLTHGNVSLDGNILMAVVPIMTDEMRRGCSVPAKIEVVLTAEDLLAVEGILSNLVMTDKPFGPPTSGWDDDPFDLGRVTL